ncbi:MAG: molybdopterin-dependent oxidoreductase [Eggerthellaceae bacterium]|nr:molybdopterin-dependent oxidoreductase [Eggerthellaceae bacterium]
MYAIQEGETRHTTCVFCDGGCPLLVKKRDGEIIIAPANPASPAICSKAINWKEYCFHPDRITTPLKNVGTRTQPIFEEISWDVVLDEIADKLSALITRYGPETLAVAEMTGNTGMGGITRRFMNHLGTPNYFSPLLLCVGNTAQVHRTVNGWYNTANWDVTDLIVYFGQDRSTERWPRELYNLKAARERGAKLIVVDPRVTKTAALADEHLAIRYGTDAALLLAWINVIIEEGLYDHAFVEGQTVGFSELSERVQQYPPDRVAEICGIDAETIRRTARMYANAQAAIIPWGVVGDMQANSTSVIRAQAILRAICGFMGKSEFALGPSIGAKSNTEIADFGALPQEQREKQIGMDRYPLMSFAGLACYEEAYRAIGLDAPSDIATCSATAHPQSVFKTMETGDPYPVKAFISVGNNTIMSYADQAQAIRGFSACELVVVYEHWMTPTAQLADYVLPSDAWTERDTLGPGIDIAPAATFNQGFAEPVGECKDWYFVIKGLADRMGLKDVFPWADKYAYFDYVLEDAHVTYKEACAKPALAKKLAAPGKFLTPSGKVELYSSVLEKLGCDPLPSYIEHKEPDWDPAGYPFVIYAGTRDDAAYNTNHHQIPSLRARLPEPVVFINPKDAESLNLETGSWCRVITNHGSVEMQVLADEAQPQGTLRIPHGWWKPELPQGLDNGLSGAVLYNDGVLFSGDDWNLDPVQGLPNLRGGIHARIEAI